MTVILDPELKALMDRDQAVAVLWQDAVAGQTALLAKASDQDVAGFRGRIPIQTHWELGRYPSGSVLRLLVVLYDRPRQSYCYETFINVADPDQRACIGQLLAQDSLALHFFDSRTSYVFSKVIANPNKQRQQLRVLIDQAEADYARLGSAWNFEHSKARFQADRPM